MTEAVDAFSLTADQAGEALAKLSKEFRGAPSKDPKDVLQQNYNWPAWRDKLEAGDGETRREFDELARAAAAEENPVKAVLSGNLPEVASSEHRFMEFTAATLREIGIRDSIISDVLAGTHTVTRQEWDLTVQWKKDHMEDPEWAEALLSGNAKARRELTLATIILNGGIRGEEKRA
jgi:hypothetical protein